MSFFFPDTSRYRALPTLDFSRNCISVSEGRIGATKLNTTAVFVCTTTYLLFINVR